MSDEMIQKSLVLLKPDAIQRGLVGTIIERFEQAGLKIVGMKMQWVDKNFAKKHYAAHVNKKFYKGLENFITSGPVVAIAIEGILAVDVIRKIVGPTEPGKAMPGTIRGDFAHHAYEYADKKGIAIKNLIHASDSVESAKAELELWFNKNEIHSYKTVHEMHVF
ncbi:nucleoside-diphosphate kinase [Candidatus Woesearchaeota archaeon]|nr:nucleoside-diphosphate kinase [Candidatus Woesearchaeota archaeon]